MTARERYALFAARFQQGKRRRLGVASLEGFDFPLRLMGDGPLAELVDPRRQLRHTVIGRQPIDLFIKELRRAAFLLMPSTCTKGFR